MRADNRLYDGIGTRTEELHHGFESWALIVRKGLKKITHNRYTYSFRQHSPFDSARWSPDAMHRGLQRPISPATEHIADVD